MIDLLYAGIGVGIFIALVIIIVSFRSYNPAPEISRLVHEHRTTEPHKSKGLTVVYNCNHCSNILRYDCEPSDFAHCPNFSPIYIDSLEE